MAKRRNAPALFELLRESNSTRTGQVGNEDTRSQIGAGVVKNSAPRPPGHPAVVAEEKAAEQAKQDAIKAEQAAAEAKANAKLQTKVAADTIVESKQSAPLGIEMDSLMSMPEFKAGRPIAPKPEAVAPPKPKAEPKPAPKPEPTPEPVAAPEPVKPKPVVVKPIQEPKKHKRTPKTKAETVVVATPSKVDVTTEADTKSTPVSKAIEPKPLAEPVASPAIPTEMKDTERPVPKAPGQQAKVSGKQIELTPVRLGIFGAFILLLFFAMFVIGSWAGRSELQKEQQPQLIKAADSTLQNFGGGTAGQDDRPIDPLQIVRDMEFVTPSVVTLPATTPEQTPRDEPETSVPEQEVLNEDSRIAGSNYLHLAALADSEEARRLQIFLAENGIKSYIRVGPRGGRTVHEIITLVGIPSAGWSTSTQKLSHVREIRRLGGIWFNEHGGSIDYSRVNQSQWYKKPPQ
ncbi:MAG: hypothetical protein COB69_02195 [Phycisphaera sp.]|nr:MAG: hypothetical protein COB69_02195 [Phycisphaera sp.]